MGKLMCSCDKKGKQCNIFLRALFFVNVFFFFSFRAQDPRMLALRYAALVFSVIAHEKKTF